jgi:TonB family protein
VRREYMLAFAALLCASLAAAQQTPSSTPPQTAPAPTDPTLPSVDQTPAPSKIGGRVSAPVVIHSVEAEFSDYARRKQICGVNLVSLIVDANGMPQNVHIARSLEPSLDEKALEAVRQYRFKPAMKDGATPVPVQITVEINFRLYSKNGACTPRQPIFPSGSATPSDRVDPPVLISKIAPNYTDDARKKRITGAVTLQMTIDAEGIPQNVHVVQGLDPGLDSNAVEAVKQWRYKPATKNGVPVPFDSTANVNFRLHKWF